MENPNNHMSAAGHLEGPLELSHRVMNEPFYTSDWHIHSVASYDASLHVADLVAQAEKQGMTDYGLTDHVNDPSWIHFLKASRELVLQYARPGFHFGVELTTISGYLEAYVRKHGSPFISSF